jgi:hypothetical protein
VVDEEREVTGCLVVLPCGVSHRVAYMSLQMADVQSSPARQRVEVQPLAVLAPVASRLPGIHGTGESCVAGGFARRK